MSFFELNNLMERPLSIRFDDSTGLGWRRTEEVLNKNEIETCFHFRPISSFNAKVKQIDLLCYLDHTLKIRIELFQPNSELTEKLKETGLGELESSCIYTSNRAGTLKQEFDTRKFLEVFSQRDIFPKDLASRVTDIVGDRFYDQYRYPLSIMMLALWGASSWTLGTIARILFK